MVYAQVYQKNLEKPIYRAAITHLFCRQQVVHCLFDGLHHH